MAGDCSWLQLFNFWEILIIFDPLEVPWKFSQKSKIRYETSEHPQLHLFSEKNYLHIFNSRKRCVESVGLRDIYFFESLIYQLEVGDGGSVGDFSFLVFLLSNDYFIDFICEVIRKL